MIAAAAETTVHTLNDWLTARSQGAMSAGEVVFHAPSRVFQVPGGGENQLVQTGRALEALGVEIRLFSPWVDKLDDARLLHLFGMSVEGLELARVAKARSIPVVLSPISWHEPRSIFALADSKARAAVDVLKWGAKVAFPTAPSWKRALLTLADAVLPNSRAEADQLIRLFGVDGRRIAVVPNGVEPRFADATPQVFRESTGLSDDFILYVGRIEPRKNVLRLIEAAQLADLPLVVIGDPTPSAASYFQACLKARGANTHFLPAVAHDAPLLASAYAASRVFALPSWFETPGLAALEAGLSGSALVVSPYGCTREYFGTSALYPRPGRVREIAESLGRAWVSGGDPALKSRIQASFLWSNTAQKTMEVYDHLAS